MREHENGDSAVRSSLECILLDALLVKENVVSLNGFGPGVSKKVLERLKSC